MVLIARVEKEFGTRCRVFEEQEREARTRENDEDRLVTMAVSVRDREAEPVVSVLALSGYEGEVRPVQDSGSSSGEPG